MNTQLIIPKQRLADKEFFEKKTKIQRSQYIKQMLKTPQVDGDMSKIKKIKFQNNSLFEFKGHKLNYNYIQNTTKPTALLFFFHGMNCHSNHGGLLGKIVSQSCNKTINVYGLDFLNAGRSDSNEPGYYQSFEFLFEQAYSFIQFIMSKWQGKQNNLIQSNTQEKQSKPQPKLKIFVSGFSMGGMICFELGTRYPKLINGIIFLAPAFKLVQEQGYVGKKLGSFLSYMFPKTKHIPQQFDNRTQYKMQQLIKADQQCYTGRIAYGTLMSLISQSQKVSSSFNKLATPYILFQGGIDKYINPFLPIDLQHQSPSNDKTTIYYKHMWHEVPNEPEYEEICGMVGEWIKGRV